MLADRDALNRHVEHLVSGTSVAHILQDDGCILLEESRPGIAVQIAEKRMSRPIRHGILAEWTFIPIDAKILGNGKYDQLLLTQDYLRLRSSLGRMCNCPASAGCRPTTVDYTMLLRDVTVIEMGTELVPWTVFLPIIWCALLPLLWLSFWHGELSGLKVPNMNYAFGVVAALSAGISGLSFLDDTDSAEEPRLTAWAFCFLSILCLFPTFLVGEMALQHVAVLATCLLSYLPGVFFFSIYGNKKWILSLVGPFIPVVLMSSVRANFVRCLLYAVAIYAIGVSVSSIRGWTRRPYVYFGVLVGSAAREGSGFGKGTSPFWVRMARGQTMVVLGEVVESVRNAAKMSLQQDLAYAKKGSGNIRDGESAFNPVYDQTENEKVSAAQVVVDHTVSELGAGMMLMTMEGVPWLVATLSNAFVLLGAFIIGHLEVANRNGEGLVGALAVSIGFDDTKVI